VFGLQPGDIGPDLRLVPASLEKFLRPGPGIIEQRFVNEVDGRRRALDVQEDGADLLQVDAVRSGM
jgi:hypothetical protein